MDGVNIIIIEAKLLAGIAMNLIYWFDFYERDTKIVIVYFFFSLQI